MFIKRLCVCVCVCVVCVCVCYCVCALTSSPLNWFEWDCDWSREFDCVSGRAVWFRCKTMQTVAGNISKIKLQRLRPVKNIQGKTPLTPLANSDAEEASDWISIWTVSHLFHVILLHLNAFLINSSCVDTQPSSPILPSILFLALHHILLARMCLHLREIVLKGEESEPIDVFPSWLISPDGGAESKWFWVRGAAPRTESLSASPARSNRPTGPPPPPPPSLTDPANYLERAVFSPLCGPWHSPSPARCPRAARESFGLSASLPGSIRTANAPLRWVGWKWLLIRRRTRRIEFAMQSTVKCEIVWSLSPFSAFLQKRQSLFFICLQSDRN